MSKAASESTNDQQECRDVSSELIAKLKKQRVRAYQLRYLVPECPFDILQLVNWLVIENTTLEDASNVYECFARYLVTNPTQTNITSEKSLPVNPGKVSPVLIPSLDLPLNSIFFFFHPSLPTSRSD